MEEINEVRFSKDQLLGLTPNPQNRVSFEVCSEEIPGFSMLKAISKSKNEKFHYYWSIFITAINLYNIFTSGYFLGNQNFPHSIWVGLEISSEGILVIDYIIRLRYFKQEKISKMWFLQENLDINSFSASSLIYYKWVCLTIASVPYSMLFQIIKSPSSEALIFLRFLKLLRLYQVRDFFNNLRLISQSSSLKIIIFEISLQVFTLVHFAGVAWLYNCNVEKLTCFGEDYEDYQKYLFSVFWASETITGVFLEAISTTENQKYITFFVMNTSILWYAYMFCVFTKFLHESNKKRIEKSNKKQIVENWCKKRNISEELKQRIANFYSLTDSTLFDSFKVDLPEELPLSLKSELALHIYSGLISKVKLFELGEPAFTISMIRSLTSEVYFAGDFIIRLDDLADSMYFVSSGLTEVIAVDGVSRIALLDDGCYFGEIGILLNCCRTVYVKAVKNCLLAKISKSELMPILHSFPEYQHFLFNVAKQRIQTCKKEDIDCSHDLVEDNFSSSDSDKSEELETPQYFAPGEHQFKSFWLRILTVPFSRSRKGATRIDPLSWFFYCWALLLTFSFSFCLFLIPYSIAFNYDTTLLVIDAFSYTILVLDLFVNYNSSIITEFKTYVHDKEYIQQHLFDTYFALDIVSVLPSDWVYYSIDSTSKTWCYLKILRIFKLIRVFDVLKTVQSNTTFSVHIQRFLLFIYLFFVVGHISACFFKSMSVDPQPRIYLDYVYWSYSIYSQTSFGDIGEIGLFGSSVLIFLINLSKIWGIFLFAECCNMIKEFNKVYSDFVSKFDTVDQWMNHIGLSQQLRRKMKSHYFLTWDKLQGHSDEEILNEFPEALATDLRIFLLSGLRNCGLFPNDLQGAMLGIMRKCKILMYSQGTTIINHGDLGLEMFFIIEGKVEVISNEGVLIKELEEHNIFGEFALLDKYPSARRASVIAKSDLTLAVLSVDDFKLLCNLYPGFKDETAKLANSRIQKNIVTNSIGFSDKIVIATAREKTFDLNNSTITENSEEKIENSLNFETEVYEKFKTLEFNPLTLKIQKSKIKNFVYAAVWLWNILFIPALIAYKFQNNLLFVVLEYVSILFYALTGIYYFLLYRLSQSKSIASKEFLFYSAFHVIISIPFAYIFIESSISTFFLLFLGYIRIANFYYIIYFFQELKHRYIFNYRIIFIFECFLLYLIAAHILACNFILIQNASLSEFSREDLYINAFYWAITGIAHSSLGDIKGITYQEKFYTCCVQFFSFFFFGLLVGSVSSLIFDLSDKLRFRLCRDYCYTLRFLKQKEIENKFLTEIDDYFNNLWKKDKGIVDAEALKSVPQTLKIEIFLFRYGDVLERSESLKSKTELNMSLIRSICLMMQVQYNLVGDVILRMDDISCDMFFLIHGEVSIVALEGNKTLDVLTSGSHFGEINLLYFTSLRTATVVTTKISQIGVISKKNIKVLFRCFPEWKEKLQREAEKRMLATFGTSNADEVRKHCEIISQRISKYPDVNKKYIKRTQHLISQMVASYLPEITKDKYLVLQCLHLITVIYTCFAIPAELTNKENKPNFLITLDMFCLLEAFFFLMTMFSNSARSLKNQRLWDQIKYHYKKHLVADFSAISPFNVYFSLFSLPVSSGTRIFLMCIRLYTVFRIHSLVSKLAMARKDLFQAIRITESFIYFLIFLHWNACIVRFNYSCDGFLTYLDSLYFTMTLITGSSHTDVNPCTNNLKIQVCIIISISMVAFSMIYGLLASTYTSNQQKIDSLFNELGKRLKSLKYDDAPHILKKRIRAYVKFSTLLNFSYGEIKYKEIFLHMPQNIVHNFIYEYCRHNLKKVPFLKNNESEVVTKRIALSLKPKIYMPYDYVIYKDDVGEEMFFIDFGKVKIISPDNSKIIKTLSKGDFVGEMALINNSRRMCSVIASSLCLIHALTKKDFDEILQGFPEVLLQLRRQSEIRTQETKSLTRKSELEDEDSHEEKSLLNHISMYSMLSGSISNNERNHKKFGMICGMKNIKTGTSIERLEKDRSQDQVHKRKPGISHRGEKRLSQLSLGKDIIESRLIKLRVKWQAPPI